MGSERADIRTCHAERSPRVAIHRTAPRCRLGQRIEHRLQIEGRAADDLEHVGGGGLLLQRFAQLVEQPRVLDGDDGLVGEVLDQLDLLVGEWPDLLAVDADDPDELASLSIGTVRSVRAPPYLAIGSSGPSAPCRRCGAPPRAHAQTAWRMSGVLVYSANSVACMHATRRNYRLRRNSMEPNLASQSGWRSPTLH